MKNLNFLMVLLFPILFSSCETRIEDDRRIVITGKIQDQNGNPLANINVISGSESFQLGSIQSDENGKFLLTSLSIDNGDFNNEDDYVSDRIREININAVENDFDLVASNEHYNSIRIFNNQPFTGVEIDLGNITLNELALVTIHIDKSNFTGEELNVFFSAIGNLCTYELEQAVSQNELNCDNLDSYPVSRKLSGESDMQSFEIQTLLGASMTITVVDAADNTLFNQEFEINEANQTIDISL